MTYFNQFSDSLAILENDIIELKKLYDSLEGDGYNSFVVYNTITDAIRKAHAAKKKFLAEHNIEYVIEGSYVDV